MRCSPGRPLALAALGLFMALPADALPIPRAGDTTGLIVTARGDAEIAFIEAPAWRTAEVQQDLVGGDELRTGRAGGLAILFADRTQMRVGRNSRLTVKAVAGQGASHETLLELARGVIWSRAEPGGTGIDIQTPAATAAIRGTDWSLSVDESGRTQLIVLDGEVALFNELGQVTARPGEIATALPGRAPTKTILVQPATREQLLLYADVGSSWTILPPSGLPNASVRAVLRRWQDGDGTQPAIDVAEAALTQNELDLARSALATARTQGTAPARIAYVEGYLLSAGRQHADAAQAFGLAADGLAGDRRIRAMVQQSLSLLSAGDAAGSERIERQLDPLAASEPGVTLLQVVTTLMGGDTGAAAEKALEAARRFPDDPQTILTAMRALSILDRGEEMRTLAEQTVATLPDEPESWLARGIWQSEILGDEEAAAASFRRSLELRPNDTATLNEYALSQSDLDEDREAEQALRRAVALDPGDTVAKANLAGLLLAQDRLAEARPMIDEVRTLDPGFSTGYVNAGLLAMLEGRIEEARALMLLAGTADPGEAMPLVGLAAAEAENENYPAAQEAIRKALQADPNDALPALVGSVFAQDLAQADEAIRLSREANLRLTRNGGAGQSRIAASRDGSTSLGSAFTFLGLNDWGTYYADRWFSDFDATSLQFRAATAADASTRASSLAQGLLVDPTSASSRLRYSDVFRRPFLDKQVSLAGGFEEKPSSPVGSASFDIEGYRNETMPLAFGFTGVTSSGQGTHDNDSQETSALALFVGARPDPFTGITFEGSLLHDSQGIPGVPLVFDTDNRARTDDGSAALGWSYQLSARNIVMARLSGGVTDLRLKTELSDDTGYIRQRTERRTARGDLDLRHAIAIGDHELSYGLLSGIREDEDTVEGRGSGVPTARLDDESTTYAVQPHLNFRQNLGELAQFEAGLFPTFLREGGDAKGPRLGLRIGAAVTPVEGHWLRLAYRDQTDDGGIATLAPTTTVGLVQDNLLTGDGGRSRAVIGRWDAEWTERLFTRLQGTWEDLQDVGIQVPNTLDQLSVDNARVASLSLSTNVWLDGGIGLFATGFLRQTDNRDDGPGHGEQLPTVAGRGLTLGFTWVHPSQVRVTMAQLLEDDRGQNAASGKTLDSIASTNLDLSWQPLSKHLELGLGLSNLFDNRNEWAAGIRGAGRTVLARASLRW